MKKVLKIKFVKFERALVMQILEQNGVFPSGMHVKIAAVPEFADEDKLYLRGSITSSDFCVRVKCFTNNDKRDEYLDKVVKWISEEQFATNGKLEIGKVCEFSSYRVNWYCGVYAGMSAKQLGEPRFLELRADKEWLARWKYARPLASCVRPKKDGDVYTWQMEVAE